MIAIPDIHYFCLEELVDKPIFEKFGVNVLWFLDRSLVMCLDRLRDTVGPLTINNWHVGGSFHESGLRLFDTQTGAFFSQHKYGKAFDLKPQKITVEQLYLHIVANHEKYPQITTIENPAKTKTWLHVDSRWHEGNELLIVEP